jgi:hypothetical protein
LRRTVRKKFTDVPEVLAASIIRAMSVMEAASTSESNYPEDSHIHTRRGENIISHTASISTLEDEYSMLLRNAGIYQRVYTA